MRNERLPRLENKEQLDDPKLKQQLAEFLTLLNSMFAGETVDEAEFRRRLTSHLDTRYPEYIMLLGYFMGKLVEYCCCFEFENFIYMDYIGHLKGKKKIVPLTEEEKRLLDMLKGIPIIGLVQRMLIDVPLDKDIVCEVEIPEMFCDRDKPFESPRDPEQAKKYFMAKQRIELYEMAGFILIPVEVFRYALAFVDTREPTLMYVMIRPKSKEGSLKRLLQTAIRKIAQKIMSFHFGYTETSIPPVLFKIKRKMIGLSIYMIAGLSGKIADLYDPTFRGMLSKKVRQMLDQYPATRRKANGEDSEYFTQHYNPDGSFKGEPGFTLKPVETKKRGLFRRSS
ncbi:MAG: hypothetical protein JW774_00525 [Candidatus Aureabacteria bacterium]|nr:hypothetical protein [Candidatus Auribacterota bacterium]